MYADDHGLLTLTNRCRGTLIGMILSENRSHFSGSCTHVGMILSENRSPLFGIMPAAQNKTAREAPRR
jgi:hypothetical protein